MILLIRHEIVAVAPSVSDRLNWVGLAWLVYLLGVVLLAVLVL